MKKKLIILWIMAIPLLFVVGCTNKADALDIQKPYTYDAQYFKNLKAYKKSEHTLFFGWYAAYAPVEGAKGYKDPASWGERIIGLPDSLDIVSLWQGIPTNDPSDSTGYAPIAYKDLQYVQKVKGTKFIVPTIIRFNKEITLKDGTKFDLRLAKNRTNEGIKTYSQYLMDQVLDNDLDGLDLDYEPEGDWIEGDHFTTLVKYLGKYFGPLGNKNKILTIDFYNQNPPKETGKYANYFIRQSYNARSAGTLQSQYNVVQNAISPNKFIVTENFGDYAENGGVPFTEADGNTKTTDGKSQMYSLEGMAKWNPTQGKKAGFGAFYFGRDYYSKTGIPYYNIRRAIQIANPAVH